MAGRVDGHGEFFGGSLSELEMIAPKTVFVQAKTYFGGGEWVHAGPGLQTDREDFRERKLSRVYFIGI